MTNLQMNVFMLDGPQLLPTHNSHIEIEELNGFLPIQQASLATDGRIDYRKFHRVPNPHTLRHRTLYLLLWGPPFISLGRCLGHS